MKSKNLLLQLIFIFGASMMICLIPSCGKGDPDGELPDALFNATVSGAVSQTIAVNMPKNTSSGGATANGAYNSTINRMQIQAIQSPTWSLSISANTGGVKTGTFAMNQGGADIGMFYNTSLTSATFTSISGSITIDKATKHSELGNISNWFVDGSFTMKLIDSSSPPDTVNASGTFSGISIGAN